MYRRYDIPVREASPAAPVPNRFRPLVSRWRLAALLLREAFHYRFDRELLMSRPCIYGVFSGPVGGFWPIRRKCVGCMRCVQEYPDMCRVLVEPRWSRLGDSYFTPDAISTLDLEATTGKVPVRGVGYKGPFTGPGFDSFWTDMSEIVRPTRDGIYGRENISTAVDVGRQPRTVSPEAPEAPCVELPLPLLFDHLGAALSHPTADAAIRRAARRLGTLFVSPRPPERSEVAAWVPLIGRDSDPRRLPVDARMIEYRLDPGEGAAGLKAVLAARPGAVTVARLDLEPRCAERILELYRHGLGAFHLCADYHGKERAPSSRHLSGALLAVHRALVAAGIRDEVTLVVSGGIVRAEHVPKALLCGADLVALDTPLLVALHAEFLGECVDADSGDLRTRAVDPSWGEQRIVNLCASWRNQLLEIASAMGLRDVRRMRGETGRAIFFEELEGEWRGLFSGGGRD